MLLWGLILGSLAGFFLACRFAGRGFPAVPFFMRFVQAKNSSQLDLRLMLEEMRQKTEDLVHKSGRIDLELQDLRAKVFEVEGKLSALAFPEGLTAMPRSKESAPFPDENSLQAVGQKLKVLECRQEIYRLCQTGLSRKEIARQLKLGQGEVELVLSLKGHQE